MPVMMRNDTCFEAYLYSAGTQHVNLRHSSVTTSRVTYFILQADARTCVSHSQHSKNSGEVLDEIKANGPGRKKK